jgi:hypothetical protein
MTASSNVSDTIERDIFIAAPVEKVWELVSVPGWINDGTLDLNGWAIELDAARAYLETPPGTTA